MTQMDMVRAADERLWIRRDEPEAWADGQKLELTERQCQVLGILATRLDVVHPKDDVCKQIWDKTGLKAQATLKTHIKRIRDKLPNELGETKTGALRTRHAVGYYLVSSLAETDIPPAEAYTVSSGFIMVDPLNLTVRIAEEVMPELSPIEFNIFDMLASQPGVTISHNDLYLKAWNRNSLLGMETLKVTIRNLRKKLGPVYGDAKSGIIRNEHNVGYYLLDNTAD